MAPRRKHRLSDLHSPEQVRVEQAYKTLSATKAAHAARVRPVLLMQVEKTHKRCLAVQTHALSRAPTVALEPSVVAYLTSHATGAPLPKSTFMEMRRLLNSDRLSPAERLVLLIVQMTCTTERALVLLAEEHKRDSGRDWLELWLCELQRSVVYAESLALLGDATFLDDEATDNHPDPFQHRGGAPLRPGPRSNKDMN